MQIANGFYPLSMLHYVYREPKGVIPMFQFEEPIQTGQGK